MSDTVTIKKADLEKKIGELNGLFRSKEQCPDMLAVCNIRGQIDTCTAILNGTFGVPKRPPAPVTGMAPNGEKVRVSGDRSQYSVV